MWLWFLVSQSQACLVATCTSLDDDICAVLHSATELWVNDNGCDGICSALQLPTLEVYESIECPPNFSFSFSLDWSYSTPYDDQVQAAVDCGSRGTSSDLAVGTHPKVCTDSSDCTLLSGASLPCECGLDGSAYCVPDESSSFYEAFWSACEAGDEAEYKYWNAYQSVYPLNLNPAACLYEAFQEFKLLVEDSKAQMLAGSLLSLVIYAV